MRWVLVEAASTILPEIGPGLAAYALERLRRRAIEVYLDTRLESAEGGRMQLSNGERFDADTLVWTTGVRPHPMLARLGLLLDDRGRVPVDDRLRVVGVEGAWASGDCAAVPDLSKTDSQAFTSPSAQHAVRQAKQLGDNWHEGCGDPEEHADNNAKRKTAKRSGEGCLEMRPNAAI